MITPNARSSKNYPLVQITDERELGENNSQKKQLDLVGRNKRVVDFGCATGYFAQFLNQRECQVVGVELSPEAAKVAEEHCEQVIVADLDLELISDIFPDQKFEVAVFGDVLEHLRDPWRVLNEIKQVLQPGGYVVASIPNIAHGAVRLALLQGKFEYAEFGILDNTHLRFFTRKTIQELFERTGYVIDVIDRTIVPLFSDSLLVPSVDRESVSSELAQQIEQAEDADTLQFIVRAFPISPEGKYAALNLKYETLNLKYLHIVDEKLQLQSNLLEIHRELEEFKSTLQQAQADLKKTQAEVQSKQVELDLAIQKSVAMEGSKFWKLRKAWWRIRKAFGHGVPTLD